MGDGPLYSFFIPYHLVHFEVPNAIARAVLFRDSVAKPLAGPVVEVCAVAKRDLKAGEMLDDYGMYMTYGEAVNSPEMRRDRYLPEGLVEGCTLLRDIAKDARPHLRRRPVARRTAGGSASRRAIREVPCRDDNSGSGGGLRAVGVRPNSAISATSVAETAPIFPSPRLADFSFLGGCAQFRATAGTPARYENCSKRLLELYRARAGVRIARPGR